MNLLFLTATFFEAKGILSLGEWKQLSKNYYQWDKNYLLITGIGRANVEKTLKAHSPLNFQKVINIGICGGVSGFELCGFYEPEQVFWEKELQKNNIKKTSALVTLEKPMRNPHDVLGLHSQLKECEKLGVDMEAFFLKEYFSTLGNEFKVFKIFSDSGEKDFFDHFSNRKKELVEKIQHVAKMQL